MRCKKSFYLYLKAGRGPSKLLRTMAMGATGSAMILVSTTWDAAESSPP